MHDSDGKVMNPQDFESGGLFITQHAKVGGRTKLPQIQSAVETITTSSLSTALIEANKQMQEVQARLESKKIDYNEQMARCDQRAEVLAMKQAKQRTEAENFERVVLIESNLKRERAEKRAKEEHALRLRKEKEIEALKQQYEEQLKQTEVAKVRTEPRLSACACACA